MSDAGSVAVSVPGGGGEALAFDGEEVLACALDRAFAPGAPIELALSAGEAALALRGKAIGSKRRLDGRFDVRVRLVSLRREDREALSRALRG
ncbi:MAG: hypothetical protein KF729_28035 [Sandaracinaceae bacterium]|nr:hypothetical protein [Sandaracinaceae bacterium]